MKLSQNPFYILEASPFHSCRMIEALADEKSLSEDPDFCSKAVDILTNPGKRLAAEIGWFPGLDNKEVSDLLTKLKKNPNKFLTDFQQISEPLARINFLTAVLSSSQITDEQLIADISSEIENSLSDIDAQVVLKQLNDARAIAGIEKIKSVDIIRMALERHRQEIYALLGKPTPTWSSFSAISAVTPVNDIKPTEGSSTTEQAEPTAVESHIPEDNTPTADPSKGGLTPEKFYEKTENISSPAAPSYGGEDASTSKPKRVSQNDSAQLETEGNEHAKRGMFFFLVVTALLALAVGIFSDEDVQRQQPKSTSSVTVPTQTTQPAQTTRPAPVAQPSKPSLQTQTAPSAPSVNYAQPEKKQPSPPPVGTSFEEPPTGINTPYSLPQVAWCCREEIRVKAWYAELQAVVDEMKAKFGEVPADFLPAIEQYKSFAKVYDTKCTKFVAQSEDMSTAKQLAESVRFKEETAFKNAVRSRAYPFLSRSPASQKPQSTSKVKTYTGESSQSVKQKDVQVSEPATPISSPEPSKQPNVEATTESEQEQVQKVTKDPTVLKIQRLLKIKQTGELDKATRSAILKFQRENGLPQTGKPSNQLIRKLENPSLEKKLEKEPIGSSEKSTAKPTYSPVEPTDTTVNSSRSVLRVQNQLKKLGYGLSPTGKLDDATRIAIRKYQRDRHLSVTGGITEELVRQLESESR